MLQLHQESAGAVVDSSVTAAIRARFPGLQFTSAAPAGGSLRSGGRTWLLAALAAARHCGVAVPMDPLSLDTAGYEEWRCLRHHLMRTALCRPDAGIVGLIAEGELAVHLYRDECLARGLF